MQKRLLWLVSAGIAVAGIGMWVFNAPSQRDETLARIQREGVIRIGYAVEPPYVFLNAQGALTGLEIEVAKCIVARLGIPRIEWQMTEFGALISDLEAGRFDVISAGMFITPERAQRVCFSEPTFHVHPALLVQSGNPDGLHAYEDVIKLPHIKIAVLHGSVEEAMIRELGVPDAQLIVVPDALTGRFAVESGLAGGLALSSPTIRFMALQQNLGLTEIAQPFTAPTFSGAQITGFGAAVFRKTDTVLLEAWNRQLSGFLGKTEHHRLLTRFGFNDAELPTAVTTAEILSSGVK